MTYIFRTLMALIGAAFAFAVANLFVSGVPDTTDARAEIAALISSDTPQTLTDTAPETTLVAPETGFGEAMLTALVTTIAPEQAPQPAAPDAAAAPDTPLPEAEPDPRLLSEEIAATWQDWMQSNGVATGALAVILPDGTEFGTGIGRSAQDIAPVMSLSKAITGLCVDQLLTERNLGWSTTLADIAPQMSAAGLTPRPWNDHITLGALVTHTSGLAPDYTQRNMAGDTHGALGLHRRWASTALDEGAITGQPGTYFYNNTNYAVLGVVVEALSGQSYAQACMDRIVTPAGITDAVIEGRFGSLSSYGGWEMSAMDYARLARHWFAPDQPHLTTALPEANGYRMGYNDTGTLVSHNGRFCAEDHPTGGVGSTFMATRDGTVVSVNWDGCITPAVRNALTRSLAEHLQ